MKFDQNKLSPETVKRKKISKYISVNYRSIMNKINYDLKETKINYGQQELIYIIMLNDGITQKELAEILDIGKPTVTKVIVGLQKLGYIRTKIDENDKRYKRIYLTESGMELKPQIFESFEKVNSIAYSGLSDDECTVLEGLLKRVYLNLN